MLAVSRQAGANAVEVANSVKALTPELRAGLPGSITLIPVFDRSQTIVNSVHDVRATLIIAFVLVVIVIYLFLGRAKRHFDSRSRVASFVATYVRGDVHARILDQQPHVNGADAGDRVPSR